MKNLTMSQYLTNIKSIVDNIAVAGSVLDSEDILLYMLNGLPASYNAFKTSIRTMLHPIGSDDLYSLIGLIASIRSCLKFRQPSNLPPPHRKLTKISGQIPQFPHHFQQPLSIRVILSNTFALCERAKDGTINSSSENMCPDFVLALKASHLDATCGIACRLVSRWPLPISARIAQQLVPPLLKKPAATIRIEDITDNLDEKS
ncbi:hypothetical protein M5K25_003827 [Dendrobium thyrsiflorum]|uniref:Retrovirus-related Pol polyprotein from transposon TNT 1-94 n=1 Tax=Dendrobium thyrsiflorum TaxID=117978 RepID=A0ABD0VL58_DENTH